MIQKVNYEKIKKRVESNLKILKNSKPHLILKKELITKNEFFDLKRISGLRIHKVGDILKELRQQVKITQKELAKVLNVSQTTISSWEKDEYGIPIEDFINTLEKFGGMDKDDVYTLLRKKSVECSSEISKALVSLPYKPEDVDSFITYFLTPVGDYDVLIDRRTPYSVILKIEKFFKVKTHTILAKGYRIIHSKVVNNFLSTFYSINPDRRWITDILSIHDENIVQEKVGSKMPTFEEYLASAPNKTRTHFWELPPSVCIKFSKIPSNLKLRGVSITIGRLVSKFGKNPSIEKKYQKYIQLEG